VVDLDKHAVFAFWSESTGHLIASVPAALPIKEADAGSISFAADEKIGRTQRHITGGVDRITGVVSADDFTAFSGVAASKLGFALQADPTAVLAAREDLNGSSQRPPNGRD
jgi:hypothetical protein